MEKSEDSEIQKSSQTKCQRGGQRFSAYEDPTAPDIYEADLDKDSRGCSILGS
uniref:Uncharacterized protein n=1 Tax=Oryza sativa subsp. japonica TaxID=39947 RepID=Q6H4Z6_ORYSJ|nr:hypothetical protein [Oryza sativa Japonica Group]BAD26203.1 hypothetical protein [Oryza sativa Japonica Group]